MAMSLNDYEILKAIVKEEEKGMYKVNGTDIVEIMAITSLSYHKIYQTLNKFVSEGICEHGLNRGRRATFILTTKGFDLLDSLVGIDEEIEGDER